MSSELDGLIGKKIEGMYVENANVVRFFVKDESCYVCVPSFFVHVKEYFFSKVVFFEGCENIEGEVITNISEDKAIGITINDSYSGHILVDMISIYITTEGGVCKIDFAYYPSGFCGYLRLIKEPYYEPFQKIGFYPPQS